MNGSAFQDALIAAGVSATVEARGRVAIIVSESADLSGEARRRVVALARQHGFSNVCVELAPLDANLPGD